MLVLAAAQYHADITTGSLMPLESRRIAALLLTEPDAAAWCQAIETDNLLQKNTLATARRQAALIRKRLLLLDAPGWQMICERESEVQLQLLLAAAALHSALLSDFLRNVYAMRQHRLEPALAAQDWPDFLADCAHHNPAVANWTAATRAKLREVIVRILVEAKYLDNARHMKLTPQSLHPDVRRYLAARYAPSFIDCLERAPWR